ncbi:MAG: FkbM family methyltransferase [Opitutaceae bacterium]|jgi:FkbM family methyltransferase
MLSKCKTAGTLLARGDLAGFERHSCLNLRRLWVALNRGRPFVYRRLGFGFICYPDMRDSVELWLNGAPDALELSLLRAWLEPGDAAVDVGANLGVYAFAAANAVRNRGRVLAIEPSPRLVGRMRRAAGRLGLDSIHVCETCAGEAPGETEFFVADERETTGEQSRRVDSGHLARYRRIAAAMDTLDNLAAAHLRGESACLVKLDVEGAEVLALRGARALLSMQDAAFWLVEINLPALTRFGFGAADLLSHFPPATFESWLIPQYPRAPGRTAPPRSLGGAEHFEDAAFYNLVALPRHGRWAERTPRVRKLLRRD